MKLLILQHVPHEHPGYISDYVREKNIKADVVKLWEPYLIPKTAEYSGVIILGGPMGVYEDFVSKNDELKLIKEVAGKIPLLGICLGSQLLAHAFDGDVHPNKNGKEIGYYDLELTEAGKKDSILKGFSPIIRALEWHGDAFELPQNATLLVSSPLCTNQAFSYMNAYGFLFHFEFTPEMVRNQISIDREWTHKDFELDEERLVHDAERLSETMKQQCYMLLDNFVR